jgi:hypothetical protein
MRVKVGAGARAGEEASRNEQTAGMEKKKMKEDGLGMIVKLVLSAADDIVDGYREVYSPHARLARSSMCVHTRGREPCSSRSCH